MADDNDDQLPVVVLYDMWGPGNMYTKFLGLVILY